MPEKLPPGNREREPEKDEWPWVWDGADKAHKSWKIVGPIHAAITNWKAWAVIASVVAFLKSDDIITLMLTAIEVIQ